MNEQQAKAAMKKLWGDKAGWRRNEKALVGEAREAELAREPGLKAARETAKAAKTARYNELLKDPEYVRLTAEHEAARSAHQKCEAAIRARRVTVGTLGGAAGLNWFTIKGEGDNWQEALDAA